MNIIEEVKKLKTENIILKRRNDDLERRISGTGTVVISTKNFRIDRATSVSEMMNKIGWLEGEIGKIQNVLHYE